MKAYEVKEDDVFTAKDGSHWMVRNVELNQVTGSVWLTLAAGRTDPGEKYEFKWDEDLGIYRGPRG